MRWVAQRDAGEWTEALHVAPAERGLWFHRQGDIRISLVNAVLQIHAILVWIRMQIQIRIHIRGFIYLWLKDPDPAIFFFKTSTKKYFFPKFFAYYFLKVHLPNFLKI